MNSREECVLLAAKVAEVGAALCCYAPGHGNPDLWPTSKCDCKYGATGRGEQTGCAEARTLHRMLTPSAHDEVDSAVQGSTASAIRHGLL